MDEMNSGKVLYALIKVKDPNTELLKNVWINWVRRGVTASVCVCVCLPVVCVCAEHLSVCSHSLLVQSGEGVPSSVKGTCVNHVADVTRFFRVSGKACPLTNK